MLRTAATLPETHCDDQTADADNADAGDEEDEGDQRRVEVWVVGKEELVAGQGLHVETVQLHLTVVFGRLGVHTGAP